MKIIKKVVILFVFLSAATSLMAQPPKPTQKPGQPGNVSQRASSINRAPIATATGLMLFLGAGVFVYTLRKNKSKEDVLDKKY